MNKLINQFFELEQRVNIDMPDHHYQRLFQNIKSHLEESGYIIHNPFGEKYMETRTDCEASISGNVTNDMVIKQVIKPAIYQMQDGNRKLIQKAIVIVEKL